MNKVILTGRLTKDGEIRTSDNENHTIIYSNSIAVNRSYKNKDGKYDTDFFDFKLFNASDNFTKYLTKGKQVLLEAKIQKRKYEKDGKEKYLTEIIAENIELLSSEKKEEKQEEPTLKEIGVPDNYTTEYEEADSSVKLNDNDLPF